jgi:hypothetical protein
VATAQVSAAASSVPRPLVRSASRLSGLPARAAVRTASVPAAQYDALLTRARAREYPASLRKIDERTEALLGLTGPSTSAPPSRAWYDPTARRLFVQRRPSAQRRVLLNEVVRALVDQNYNLRRLTGLRARDHDRWLAAYGIVNGTAALVSGLRAATLHGSPLDRFSQLEESVGTGPGRTLAAQLRSIGGNAALATALRTFPQTTEQLLHIDKFLEREPALPVSLPQRAGPATLENAETLGELDVRNLLQAFAVPSAVAAADGWGGGRLALYDDGNERVGAIVLRWDSPEDAVGWQAAVSQYVAAAFPGATPAPCPPLDRCWTGSGSVAVGVYGTTSVLASGEQSAQVAAALLTLK